MRKQNGIGTLSYNVLHVVRFGLFYRTVKLNDDWQINEQKDM